MENFIELKTPVNVDFSPKDVKFPRYALQNTLGKAEAEEMAARFLEFWQENDQWKAVNAKLICERLDEQANNFEKFKGIYTLMFLPCFIEIGTDYLMKHEYIEMQYFDEGDDSLVYVGPTNKLLEAIRPFVQKQTNHNQKIAAI